MTPKIIGLYHILGKCSLLKAKDRKFVSSRVKLFENSPLLALHISLSNKTKSVLLANKDENYGPKTSF